MDNKNNHSDDFLNDELFEEPSKNYNIMTLVALFLVGIGLIASSWYIYHSYNNKNDSETLVISADHETIKAQPEDPGGMIVSNMDKAVYEAIDSHPKTEKVEVLLPPTEEPIDKKTIIAVNDISSVDININVKEESKTATGLPVMPEPVKVPVKKITENIPAVVQPEKVVEEEYIKPIAKKESTKKKVEYSKKSDTFYKVQIASFKSRNDAEKEWNSMSKRFPKLLKPYQHYIVDKDIEGKGIFHRLQVGPFNSESDAYNACKRFKESSVNCFIIKP